jgi:SPP1 family predicted phage head-tail adaptor
MTLAAPAITDPGKLDRRITLQKYTSTTNEFGELIETWEDIGSCWASKRELAGTERFAAAQLQAQVDTVFTIRYRSDVEPRWRAVCEGETYDIQSIAELNRREFLMLETLWRDPGVDPAAASHEAGRNVWPIA